jgi:hypothetical protein
MDYRPVQCQTVCPSHPASRAARLDRLLLGGEGHPRDTGPKISAWATSISESTAEDGRQVIGARGKLAAGGLAADQQAGSRLAASLDEALDTVAM